MFSGRCPARETATQGRGSARTHRSAKWLQEMLFRLLLPTGFSSKRSDDAWPPRQVVLSTVVSALTEGSWVCPPQRDTEHDVTRNGVKSTFVNSSVDRINEEGLAVNSFLLLHAALDLLRYQMASRSQHIKHRLGAMVFWFSRHRVPPVRIQVRSFSSLTMVELAQNTVEFGFSEIY